MAVVIDDQPIRAADVVAVARGKRLELGPRARERIAQSRAIVERYIEGPELIYGLNTGLGHMRDTRVPLAELRRYQPAIVAMHAGGIGQPLPVEVVRAAMAVRVAGIARGGSGASAAVVETLVAMLNAGVHPLVPTVGSVGAGDLMHMATIGLVVIGQGRAEYQGELLPGDQALQRAGIAPVTLEPKDGLALVSANGVSVGGAALLVARADAAADLADVVLACSLDVARGNVSVLDPVVARAKPVAGQAESARRILALLSGSERCREGAAASVQDPLSFRVGPQVHGALRQSISQLTEQVDVELSAMDDNPLVDIEGGRLISNGNFHPLAMALAADALRPALAHVGQLSDRRLNHLWTTVLGSIDPTDMDVLASAAELGGLLMRYASAARYTELREMAGPVTLDVAPLDLGVEDHATNAALAITRSAEAVDLLVELLAVELLIAGDGVRMVDPQLTGVGAGVRAVLLALADVRADLGATPPTDMLHAAVRAALFHRILPAANSAIA